MSISLFSTASTGIQMLGQVEKDAQQKAAEANAEGTFASLLAQQQQAAGADVPVISGLPGKVVIPAVLIDAGVTPTGPGLSVSDMQSGTVDKTVDARDAFLDFAQKTPAEQMRALVLAEMGLTEEQLAALDDKTRAEIEAKIRIRIEAKVRDEIEKQSGVVVGQLGGMGTGAGII